MPVSRPRTRCQAIVGAVVLLMIVLVRPGMARGDCSHGGDRPVVSLAMGPDRDAGVGWDFPAPGPSRPVDAPRPCDGPQCSGRRAPAPVAAASEVAPRLEWAIAGPTPPPAADPTIPPARRDDAPILPSADPTSVFHPPRPTR